MSANDFMNNLCAPAGARDAMLDNLIAQHAEAVRRFGWSVVHVTADGYDLTLSYTVGLCRLFHGHPELMVSGMEPGAAHALLNGMVNQIRVRPCAFSHAGDVTIVEPAAKAHLLEVPAKSALRMCPVAWHLSWIRVDLARVPPLTGPQTPASDPSPLGSGQALPHYLQVVLADERGEFPWDDAYSGGQQQIFGPDPLLAQTAFELEQRAVD